MQTDPLPARRPLPGREWPVALGPTTQPAAPSIVRAWRADPRPFYVAVLLLQDTAQVQRRRRTLLDALHPWCLATAPNQPHVTLAALGTDPAAARRAHDVAGGHLAVTIGGADAFASAVFLHVRGQRLALLREAVLAAAGSEEDPPDRWVPHVTVGTFRQAIPTSELRARLRPWRHLPPMTATGSTTVMAVNRRSRTGGMLRVEFRP